MLHKVNGTRFLYSTAQCLCKKEHLLLEKLVQLILIYLHTITVFHVALPIVAYTMVCMCYVIVH